MENNERCANCATYPFCNRCEGPLAWCENWKKRKIGEKRNYGNKTKY